ncbi:kinase-like domain-containing protein [Apodospora peruviana]|uniref:Kinase-like domain-containing protein n=1 Tax=Apodospora peruviana TaxID=516989 RepID=A0AAE0IQE3_9PEZI|nr:kinase-like domain-containing protein [Apodospora peruviana]
MDCICAECGRDLPRTSFTSNQYSKGAGWSRCAGCVHGHYSDSLAAIQSDGGRYNRSNRATIPTNELRYPFASGAFHCVAKGRHTSRERAGQACVSKWFKTGVVFEDDYFALDIKAVDKALEIVNRFNQLAIVQKPIKVNVPEVWTFDDDCDGDWAGSRFLNEHFIQNYQKFNSNSGHFSYHVSGGNYVLCDLQGGIYQHEVVLSDPVILSRTREYGVTDLGSNGISSFFYYHDCNEYCRPYWTIPANPVRHYRPALSTSMITLCRRPIPSLRNLHGQAVDIF